MKVCSLCGSPEVRTCPGCDEDLCEEHMIPMNHHNNCPMKFQGKV